MFKGLVLQRNWIGYFERMEKELATSEGILKCLETLERKFWFWFWISLAECLVGIFLFTSSVAAGMTHSSPQMLILAAHGIFLALVGLVSNLSIWVAVQVRVATLWLLYEDRRRQEAEPRRSLAEDL
jgi:hypothetical protein